MSYGEWVKFFKCSLDGLLLPALIYAGETLVFLGPDRSYKRVLQMNDPISIDEIRRNRLNIEDEKMCGVEKLLRHMDEYLSRWFAHVGHVTGDRLEKILVLGMRR